MAQKITSLKNELIKELYYELHQNKKSHLMIIESLKVINELVAQNENIKHILCLQSWYDENKTKLEQYKDIVIVCTEEILSKLCFVKTNSNVALIIEYRFPSFQVKPNDNYLIINEVQDPHNMANILRTSVAFNCKNLFISHNGVSLYNEKVVRACMGSLFQINVCVYEDIEQVIKQLKQNRVKVIATCIDNQAIKLNEFYINDHFAFIVGNESKGLSTKVISQCDYKVFIDINNIDSLNVASAFAITLHWLTKGHVCKK